MTEHSDRLSDWPSEEWEPILIEIGRVVFNWNTFEVTLKRILHHMVGGDDKLHILTAHMGNTSVTDAIRTYCNEFYYGETKDHVLHLLQVFDRARQYRNYYVHSFNGVTLDVATYNNNGEISRSLAPGSQKGQMKGHSARSRLVEHKEELTHEEIREASRMLKKANHYAALVSLHVRDSQRTLPDKFPVPKKLKKPLHYLLDKEDQP